MKTKVPIKTNPDEVPASLSPESLDRLADLVVAKLMAKNNLLLPSNQIYWVLVRVQNGPLFFRLNSGSFGK